MKSLVAVWLVLVRAVAAVDGTTALCPIAVAQNLSGGVGSGVGSGIVREQSRVVPTFSAIAIESSVDLRVTMDRRLKTPSVTVRADHNIIPLIETKVRDGTFYVSLTRGIITRSETVVLVTVPRLDKASQHASGDLVVKDLFTENFSLDVEGSGDVSLSGEVGKLDVKIEGSGDMSLDNVKARELALRCAGSGNIRFTETVVGEGAFVADDADRKVKAGGEVGKLSVEIDGSGHLALTNVKARIVDLRYAGSGGIKIKDIAVSQTLSLVSDGNSNIRGSGKVDKLVIASKGNDNVSLEALTAVNCDVDNSGNGNVKVRATGNLRAKTHGSGDIIYYGNPQDVKSEQAEQTWLGKVRKAVEK
ncbi:MAG: hypothetical protein GXY83_41105 [Rhodopirellula sp.]|nr:hypothetical protein [Rhodopirellula sp.]